MLSTQNDPVGFFAPEEIATVEQIFKRAFEFVKASGDCDYMTDQVAAARMVETIIAVYQTGEQNTLKVLNLAINRFRVQHAGELSERRRHKKAGVRAR
jgi:hypothetical protein